MSIPKREGHAGQRQIMGTKTFIGKGTALGVKLRVRVHLWPLWRDDSSRVPIGTAGSWRSDWRMRDVGALIGQSACRLWRWREKRLKARAKASSRLSCAQEAPVISFDRGALRGNIIFGKWSLDNSNDY